MAFLIHLLLIAATTQAQSGFTPPVIEQCPNFANDSSVACVDNYASVLPYPFVRATASNGSDPENDTFVDTSVPSDSSFPKAADATFVVFDREREVSTFSALHQN